MRENIQEKLSIVRPPRLHLKYEFSTKNTTIMKELPFVVGVMGEFTGYVDPDNPIKPLKERSFINIDSSKSYIFNEILRTCNPRVNFKVENTISFELTEKDIKDTVQKKLIVDITFNSIDDFRPNNVALKIPELVTLIDKRDQLLNMLVNREIKPEQQKWLDKIINDKSIQEKLNKELQTINIYENNTLLLEIINSKIKEINQLLQKQLNSIIHHPDFQKLESSWRGLHYLVMQSEISELLKIQVLNLTKDEMEKDLTSATSFDESSLYKIIYTNKYKLDEVPFGVLIGDYYFRNRPQDIDILTKISYIAAAAHTPFISSASPKFFELENYTELNKLRYLSKIFDGVDYAKWRSFRELEESRYIVLTLPRILMRSPYGKNTDPIDSLPFEEDVIGEDKKQYLWGNAAYALGARITNAFSKYGWCESIVGPEGGLLEGLPYHFFDPEEERKQEICSIEVLIPDYGNEFSELGFTPLIHCKGSGNANFFRVQTTRKRNVFNDPEANVSERIFTQLQYILSACRIAHYVKRMVIDKTGSMMDQYQISNYLNEWITEYVTNSPGDSQSIKARKPFKSARISVNPVKEMPGFYAHIILRTHLMKDVDISIVATLPPLGNQQDYIVEKKIMINKDIKKVFISYAKEDYRIAKKLYNDIKSNGIIPWIDCEDILPGQDWKKEISQAIKDSSYFLALLSSNSISKKGYVQKELKLALEIYDEFPNSVVFIIPVRIDNCIPDDERLKILHWSDLFPSYNEGLQRILKVILR